MNNKKNPTVSIVISTFNRPELLARALRSVVAQTFTDWEAVVVDDGDQRVRDVVESFHDPRFRYIANEPPRRGGAAARNAGIKAATGEYVALLDDDDRWIPEKLGKQVVRLKGAGEKTVFCFSAVKNIHDDRQDVTNVFGGEMNFLELALARFNGFLTSTLLVRKAALREVGGFDESLPSHQEPELIIRLSEKYDGIGIDEPLTIMSMESSHEHIGTGFERQIMGREILLAKHMPLFAARPKVLAKHYFQLGLWNRDSGNARVASDYFLRAFVLSWNPRYALHALALTFS